MRLFAIPLFLAMVAASARSEKLNLSLGAGYSVPHGAVGLGLHTERWHASAGMSEISFRSSDYLVLGPGISFGWTSPLWNLELWGTASLLHYESERSGTRVRLDTDLGDGLELEEGWNPGTLTVSISRRFGSRLGCNLDAGVSVPQKDPFGVMMLRAGATVDFEVPLR